MASSMSLGLTFYCKRCPYTYTKRWYIISHYRVYHPEYRHEADLTFPGLFTKGTEPSPERHSTVRKETQDRALKRSTWEGRTSNGNPYERKTLPTPESVKWLQNLLKEVMEKRRGQTQTGGLWRGQWQGLTSACFYCGQEGHWKRECPERCGSGTTCRPC